MEAWTLLDRGSQLYALLHEARVRREIIILSIKDDEVYIYIYIYIHGSNHERQYVFSSTTEEDFFEENP
jgi:hypothetical protein